MSDSHDGPQHDVRMRGFSRRSSVAELWQWLDKHVIPLGCERVSLLEASGRVLAEDITSQVDVPAFDRAMMDGYAVRAAETLGASAYNRLPFHVIGEALPGQPFAGRVTPGNVVRIMTGAPLPEGADAVLPAELTELAEPNTIYAVGEVSPGKHVGKVGEDIHRGEVVLKAGRKLRPQDVGLLSSIGVSVVPVVRKPRVRIVITGNELLPAGSKPEGYKIVDSNGPMLYALVQRDGGSAELTAIVPDDPEEIRRAILCEADVVLVSGGSSVGAEDHAPLLVQQHGKLLFHGVAMRPASPTGFGVVDQRLVFLLPGNPVSCLCAYDFFAGRAIRRLAGSNIDWPYRCKRLRLRRKISSMIGRFDYVRVKIADNQAEPLAIAGASILSSTTRADGFVLVPPESEGYPPGTEVDVFLYE